MSMATNIDLIIFHLLSGFYTILCNYIEHSIINRLSFKQLAQNFYMKWLSVKKILVDWKVNFTSYVAIILLAIL